MRLLLDIHTQFPLIPFNQKSFTPQSEYMFSNLFLHPESQTSNSILPTIMSRLPLQGFPPTVQRKVTFTIHHKQCPQCTKWEQEVLESIKLEANGPEL